MNAGDAHATVQVKVGPGAVRLLNEFGDAAGEPVIECLPDRGGVILTLTPAEAENLHAAAGDVSRTGDQIAPAAEAARMVRSMATVQRNVAAALEALPATAPEPDDDALIARRDVTAERWAKVRGPAAETLEPPEAPPVAADVATPEPAGRHPEEYTPDAGPGGTTADPLEEVARTAGDVDALRRRHWHAEGKALTRRDDAIRAALGAGASLRAIAKRAGVS